ncbi:unnamed protein product [Sphagnum troendelagicum]|uniref:Uncharacterized protein n=1 Tax=Sphagnum troendelagicum TaxID=128251 RepID=A0ABP0UPF0_9BRYO
MKPVTTTTTFQTVTKSGGERSLDSTTKIRALNSSSPAVPKATGSSAPRVRQAEHVTSDSASHGRVQRTISSTRETQSPTHPM